MIRYDVATAPYPAPMVSGAFPASPTVTQSIIPALAIEPNGRQAKAASQTETVFKERHATGSILLLGRMCV
jgi:hypothetical protein